MILAFTGTRQGLTAAQRAALPSVIATLPEQVLHGGAEGADEEFHDWLESVSSLADLPFVNIYQLRYRVDYWCERATDDPARIIVQVYPQSDPLVRNRLMVNVSDHLLACPAESTEQLRSGTWATVRAARELGRAITLIFPSGEIREERR